MLHESHLRFENVHDSRDCFARLDVQSRSKIDHNYLWVRHGLQKGFMWSVNATAQQTLSVVLKNLFLVVSGIDNDKTCKIKKPMDKLSLYVAKNRAEFLYLLNI